VSRKGKHVSETPATQWLRQRGVAFTEHPYDYVEHGGTAESARQLGWPEHAVIKTLVMQDEQARPLVVLMHGDRQVSTKALARAIGVKSVQPCAPEVAQRHSGYLVGGTSPFGLRKPMRVFVEGSVLGLSRILINGGRRGYLVGVAPQVLTQALTAQRVACAIGSAGGESPQCPPLGPNPVAGPGEGPEGDRV
jgi:Cys-tRNA(Pro) deacylase